MFFDFDDSSSSDEEMDLFHTSITSWGISRYCDHELIRLVSHEIKTMTDPKTFKSEVHVNDEDLEEICKLSELETLEICVKQIENGESLEKLKNLRKLTLLELLPKNEQRFFTFKLECLESLNITQCDSIQNPEILEIISANFPNLKVLKLESSQKLNFIAKVFPKLEKLELRCDALWEFDTGIVNENIKELHLESQINFCEIGEVFFELFEILPNLEILLIDIENCSDDELDDHYHHFTDANFFGKFITKEKLKSIGLRFLALNLEKNNLKKIGGKLIELAKKLKSVTLHFSDVKEGDFDSINSNYESFCNEINKYYTLVENNSKYENRTFEFDLRISTEKEE